jgi:GNAT superfamily N-acetyltransferase
MRQEIMQLRFEAIPRGRYCPEASGEITVFELEKRDLPALKALQKRAGQKRLGVEYHPGSLDKELHYEIIHDTVTDAVSLLEGKARHPAYKPDKQGHPIVYMAVKDGWPCGLLAGHMPLITRPGKIVFSDRNRGRETEVGWLASWPVAAQRIKGVGQLLLSHFYRYCQALKIDSIYVRTFKDTPAASFYERMGLRPSRTQPAVIPVYDPDDPGRSVTDLTRLDAAQVNADGTVQSTWPFDGREITPLAISRKRAGQVAEKVLQRFNPQPVKEVSMDLSGIISPDFFS